MRRVKIFKVFHLISDNTSSVPQKVFLKKEDLYGLQLQLKKSCKTIGLIGTVDTIKHQIMHFQQKLNIQPMDQSQKVEVLNLDFSLSKDEKAALYFLQLPDSSIQSKSNYCFVIFVAPDRFYYEKPIQENTLLYLLIRFMGDLCSDMLILYNQKIESQFQEDGCPYSITNNQIAAMKMVTRSIADIKYKIIPCNFTKLFEYDPKYSEKINLDIPIQTRYILYVQKVLQEDLEKRQKQQLCKLQNYVFDSIYIKKQKDVNKICLEASKLNISIPKNQVELLLKQYKCFSNQLHEINERYFKKCKDMLFSWITWFFGPSEEFQKLIYYYSIINQVQLFPQKKSYYLKNEEAYIIWDLLQAIISSLQITKPEQISHAKKYCFKYMSEMWRQIKKSLQTSLYNLYSLTNKLTLIQKKDQIIDAVAFEMQAISTKQGILENISIIDYSIIEFKFKSFTEKLKISSFSFIKNISIYDLNNSRKTKLFWLNLSVEKDNQFSGILLIYCGSQIIIIKRYAKKGLKFTFNKDNEKGYMIDEAQSKLTCFSIDSFYRIKQEKSYVFRKQNLKSKIISFGITIYPEMLFYLTEEANCIYSYNLTNKQELKIGKYAHSRRFLTIGSQNPYQYIKTFNESIYLVLGNKSVIDIISYDSSGSFQIKHTIKLDHKNFLGATIFSDKCNQYLIIHNCMNSIAYAFLNMNCENVLEQDVIKDTNRLGNPILDIFHEAKQRFGDYTNYNGEVKNIRLFHVTDLQPKKINNYTKELKNVNFAHQIWKKQKSFEILELIQNSWPIKKLFETIQTRIPIQMCTIQDGNILPLINGKRQSTHFFDELTVAQRSRILNFGIVEQILKSQIDKRVIVISVMGAQSTGKSYLMNRIFQTRFTVASSRTTDGVWLSVIKKNDFNYLLLDCEGLFSTDRSALQQEKLVKILASLSDYTILNQNMSMCNRSVTQLMDQISVSAKSLKKQSDKLYKGELFVIVRDVKTIQSKQINLQFKRNFQNNEKRKGNQFIKRLFGGNVNLFTINHFGDKSFQTDILTIKNHFEKQGVKRPLRNAKQILESLKILMTQLVCDDSKQFQQNFEDYRIEMAKEKVLKVWINGSDRNQKIEGNIMGKQISVFENQVIVNIDGASSMKDLIIFDDIFKSKIIGQTQSSIPSTEFNSVYQLFNDFIINFFEYRKKLVETEILKIYENELLQIKQQKKKPIIAEMRKNIYDRANLYRLCLGQCHKCKLVCISKHGHKEDIEFEKENTRIRKLQIQGQIKLYALSQQQILMKQDGLEALKEICTKQMQQLNNQKERIITCQEIKQCIKSHESEIKQQEQQINKISDKIAKCFSQNETINQQLHKFTKEITNLSEQSASIILKSLASKVQIFLNQQLNAKLMQKPQITTIKQEIDRSIKDIQQECSNIVNSRKKQVQKMEEAIQQDKIKISKQKLKHEIKNDKLNKQSLYIKDKKIQQSEVEVKLQLLIKEKRNCFQQKQTIQKYMQEIAKKYESISAKSKNTKQQNQFNKQEIQRLQKYVAQMQIASQQQRYQTNTQDFIRQAIDKILSINSQINQIQRNFNNNKDQEIKRNIYKMANIKEDVPLQTLKEDIQKKISINMKKLQKFPQNQNIKKKIAECEQILIQCEKSGLLRKNLPGNTLKEQKSSILKSIQKRCYQKTELIIFVLDVEEKLIMFIKKNSENQLSRAILKDKFISNHHDITQKDICNHLIDLSLLELRSHQQKKNIELLIAKQQFEANDEESEIQELEKKLVSIEKQIKQIEIALQFIIFEATAIGAKSIEQYLQTIMKQFLQTQNHQILKEKSINLREVNLSEKNKIQLQLQLLQNNISKLQEQYESCQNEEKLNSMQTELQKFIIQQKIKHIIFSYIIYATNKLEQYIKQSYCKFKQLNKFDSLNDHQITLNLQYLCLQWSNQVKQKQQQESLEDKDQILRQFNIFLSEVENQTQDVKEQKSDFGNCLKPYKKHKKQIALCLESLLQKLNKLNIGSLFIKQIQQIIFESENLNDIITKAKHFVISLITSDITMEKKKKTHEIQQANILIQSRTQSLKDQTEIELALQKIQKLKAQTKSKYSIVQTKIEKLIADQTTSNANRQQIKKDINQSNEQITSLSVTINQIETTISSLQKYINNKTDQLKTINSLKAIIQSIQFQRYHKLFQLWEQQHFNHFNQLETKKAKQSFLQKLFSTCQDLKKKQLALQAEIGNSNIQSVQKLIKEKEAKLSLIQTIKQKIIKLSELQQKEKFIIQKMQQLNNNSKQSCSCQTNHKCQFPCSSNCIDKKCAKPAGHLGNHLCQELNHLCLETCSKDANCKKKCTQIYGHDLSIIHNCHGEHKCLIKCQFCENICGKNQFDDHQQHCCPQQRCSYQCVLCQQKCNSGSHDHDKNTITVQISKGGELIKRKLHLCGDSHPCVLACSHPGICSYTYSDKTKTWKQKNSEEDYIYIEQILIRHNCKIKIPAGSIKHQEKCSCDQEHKCDHRCPDCKSGCALSFGHLGKHRTNHRNQELLMYAAENKNEEIQIKSKTQEQIKKFIFEVGDISTPTTCYESCKRKGRGHYHLLQCKGGKECGQRKYDNMNQGAIKLVNHSDKSYYPHKEKQYDRYLCSQYWEYCNFEMPNYQDKQEYDSCNFYCQRGHDGKQNKHLYCTKSAWHSFSASRNDHMFECDSYHKSSSFDKIQICFLIDITGSMERFIDQCKTAISKIISGASSINSAIDIKFSIIGYRDHPMSLSKISKQLKQLTIEKQSKLKSLVERPCLMQQINQPDFIAKLISVQQKFKQVKQLEGVEQDCSEYFEEEQLLLLQYHYPFVLDMETSQHFVEPSKLNILILKMLLLSSDSTRTLKDHLLQDLKFYKKQIEEEDGEDQPALQLIQKKDFTKSQEIISFLNNLTANGGGDPPEAVLDGMSAILQLNWSQSPTVMKYIFHLLDAPPHGKQFGTDNGDKFPDGCPCEKKHQPIIEAIMDLNAKYIIYPLTPRVNKTMEIFQNCGLKFEKQTIDKQCPVNFSSHAAETICSFLEQTDIMVRTV